MKRITKIVTIGLAVLLVASTSLNAQSKNKVRKMEYNSKYNFEVTTVAVTVDGTKLVKVWGYGPSVEEAIRNAKELGVACAIFRGFPAAAGGAAGLTPAIVTDDEMAVKFEVYFAKFFEPAGQYLQYANLSTDGAPSGEDRVKVNKKTYKVGVTMSIAFEKLRKEMESKGVVHR